MTQQHDSNGELRAAFTMRLIKDAKRSIQPESRPVGVFMRVTLAVIFMYLIVISYMMLGTAGLVFVSALFLVALFAPFFYQVLKDLFERRKAQRGCSTPGQESRQEG